MSTTNKLGVYYTDNSIPKIIEYTLNSLRDISLNKHLVDIKTCSWFKINNNPFDSKRALTNSKNHLNIIIQILQLLYSVDPNQYKYVCFLEHDVIYPEEYFLFPEFDTGCLCNANYIGLCDTGFQLSAPNHQPLHQMIMIFDEAVHHFEQRIKTAIKDVVLNLEPDDNRTTWTSSKACIHINHGHHFTTHYKTYQNLAYKNYPGWGYYEDIWKNTI